MKYTAIQIKRMRQALTILLDAKERAKTEKILGGVNHYDFQIKLNISRPAASKLKTILGKEDLTYYRRMVGSDTYWFITDKGEDFLKQWGKLEK